MTLPDANPSSEHLEDDFHAAYRGSHATLDEAIHAQLDGLGWADALTQMMHANGITPDMLAWNLELIKNRMDEIYDFVEFNGRIYQFLS
ncbi:hypothetical protein [Herbiconiux liangxiaofengii]|uniref:hypothetical protein n=1 Tax=Herbiconiux liangxiaofengii TaxID=3342795 RepID=UPI0035B94FDE